MKVECYGCGEDCSHAYGTYQGFPYHFGCLPVKRATRRTGQQIGDDALAVHQADRDQRKQGRV